MNIYMTKETAVAMIVGSMLPRHDAGLEIAHNPNLALYQTVAEYLEIADKPGMLKIDFDSEEDRLEAIEMDELWTMTWYPNTPVGSCCIGAATLDDLLSFATTYDTSRVL